jgi:hypothetical protein
MSELGRTHNGHVPIIGVIPTTYCHSERLAGPRPLDFSSW